MTEEGGVHGIQCGKKRAPGVVTFCVVGDDMFGQGWFVQIGCIAQGAPGAQGTPHAHHTHNMGVVRMRQQRPGLGTRLTPRGPPLAEISYASAEIPREISKSFVNLTCSEIQKFCTES